MDVFVSWSKDRSLAVARAVADFLPLALPRTEVFVSDAIPKGERWDEEIHRNLKSSKIGIACVTAENVSEGWLMYEAGAIAGALDRRLIPLLLDVKKGDLGQPLGGFQACETTRGEMLKLCASVNERTEAKYSPDQLERFFDKFWPEFEQQVARIKSSAPVEGAPKRDVPSKIDELLQLVRAQDERIGYLAERAHKDEQAAMIRAIVRRNLPGGFLKAVEPLVQLDTDAYYKALTAKFEELSHESTDGDEGKAEPPSQ